MVEAYGVRGNDKNCIPLKVRQRMDTCSFHMISIIFFKISFESQQIEAIIYSILSWKISVSFLLCYFLYFLTIKMKTDFGSTPYQIYARPVSRGACYGTRFGFLKTYPMFSPFILFWCFSSWTTYGNNIVGKRWSAEKRWNKIIFNFLISLWLLWYRQ